VIPRDGEVFSPGRSGEVSLGENQDMIFTGKFLCSRRISWSKPGIKNKVQRWKFSRGKKRTWNPERIDINSLQL
jgi:hypothetical protein